MIHAPLTNLGCENEFAKLDNNRFKVCGGTTSLQTSSQKNVVTTNAYLVDSYFMDKDDDEKRREWKWSRISEQTEIARKMVKNLLATVKQSKILALRKNALLIRKKWEKTMDILTKCKKRGGPISVGDLNLSDRLYEKSLLLEISYLRATIAPNIRLRATIAPNIRLRRRVKLPDGKFKFLKYSITELKTSIRNAIKPENDLQDDVGTLLKSVRD